MRFPVFLLVVPLLPVAAQAQVYSWRDASGKIHYGDRPPATQQGDARKLAPPPPRGSPPRWPAWQGDARKLAPPPPVNAEAERKAFLEKEMEEREKRQKSAAAAAKEEQNRAEEAKRKENCQRARANLTAIESGQIHFVIGTDGERKALDGPLRDAEIAKARQLAEEWCAPVRPAGR